MLDSSLPPMMGTTKQDEDDNDDHNDDDDDDDGNFDHAEIGNVDDINSHICSLEICTLLAVRLCC